MKSMNLDEIIKNIQQYYNEFKSRTHSPEKETTIDRALLCLKTDEFIDLMEKVKEHKKQFVFLMSNHDDEAEKMHSLGWYLDDERMIQLASLMIFEQIDLLNNKHVMNFIEYNYNFDLIDEYFLNPIIGKRQRLVQEMLYSASAGNQLDVVKKYVNAGALVSAYDIDRLPVNIAAWNASNVDCLIYLINQGGHFWYKKEDTYHTDILDVYEHVRKYMSHDDEYDDVMKAKFDEAHKITLEKQRMEKAIACPQKTEDKTKTSNKI